MATAAENLKKWEELCDEFRKAEQEYRDERGMLAVCFYNPVKNEPVNPGFFNAHEVETKWENLKAAHKEMLKFVKKKHLEHLKKKK